MPRKTTAPTGAIAQTEQTSVSSVETLLNDAIAAAQSDREVLHRATQRLATAQAQAILPYANRTVFNTMVVDQLAAAMADDRMAHAEVPSIVDVFASECDELSLSITQQADDAIQLLTEWSDASEARINNARQLFGTAEPGQRALASADTWDAEEVTVSDD
jgi:hypothetical protein